MLSCSCAGYLRPSSTCHFDITVMSFWHEVRGEGGAVEEKNHFFKTESEQKSMLAASSWSGSGSPSLLPNW